MRKIATILMFVLLSSLAAQQLLAAGGSAPTATPTPRAESTPQTPEQIAQEHYRVGLQFRDKAWKQEEKLANAKSDAERAKLTKKLLTNYKKAAAKYRNAISRDEGLFQAHSSLGYALRKVGDYPAALKAYDKALELAPHYAEAIEYRAEAYLGLNRLDEAKEAYMELFRSDRARADELMRAMHEWVEKRTANASGVSAETLATFKSWLSEREELAQQSTQLSQHLNRTW